MAVSCSGFGDSEPWSAGAVSGALSAGGVAVRPRAILAVSGPSFNARTRILRGLKNEQASSPPDLASGQAPFGGFFSTASLDARFPGSLLVVPSVLIVSLPWPLDSAAAVA